MNMKKATTGLLILLVTLVAACSSLRAGQSETAVAEPAEYILVLRMSTNGVVHSIVDSILVPSPVALSLAPSIADGHSLNYAIADSKGKIVFDAGMPNPLEVRSPLPPPGEPAKGHETLVLPQVEYVIRMPYDKAAATLQVAVGVKPVFAATSGGASAAPPPGALNFSLQPWMRSAEVKANIR